MQEADRKREIDRRTLKPQAESYNNSVFDDICLSVAGLFGQSAKKAMKRKLRSNFVYDNLEDMVHDLAAKQFPHQTVVQDGENFYIGSVDKDNRLFLQYYKCKECGYVAGSPLSEWKPSPFTRPTMRAHEFCHICDVYMGCVTPVSEYID
ncbi:MAG: hypothetical protein ACTSUV_06820 [Candidatus Ranarchaeia archaeon]